MNEEVTTIIAVMLPKELEGYGNNDMIRRVYSTEGIAPTIRTFGGAIKNRKY